MIVFEEQRWGEQTRERSRRKEGGPLTVEGTVIPNMLQGTPRTPCFQTQSFGERDGGWNFPSAFIGD